MSSQFIYHHLVVHGQTISYHVIVGRGSCMWFRFLLMSWFMLLASSTNIQTNGFQSILLVLLLVLGCFGLNKGRISKAGVKGHKWGSRVTIVSTCYGLYYYMFFSIKCPYSSPCHHLV